MLTEEIALSYIRAPTYAAAIADVRAIDGALRGRKSDFRMKLRSFLRLSG
ncbi:MAG: hypothetical protein OJI70_09785 [Zavarzinia sp.]|nr:hypothetical protein [Zavarzinia sp.]